MRRPDEVHRFSRATRISHWLNAGGVIVLIVTGAVMWGAPATQWVGHRDVVRTIHLWVGIALLVPFVTAWFASRAVRDDVRRLARWSADDRAWWARSRRNSVRLGKFNPGQKANAAFTLAALIALLTTGVMLKWHDPFSDDWRTGATAVHDWTALVLGVVVVGHVAMALRDRAALRAMISGFVPSEWARIERPRWHAELVNAAKASATSDPDSAADSHERDPQIDPDPFEFAK